MIKCSVNADVISWSYEKFMVLFMFAIFNSYTVNNKHL